MQRDAPEGAWFARPGRAFGLGWGVFVFVDVMTRLTIYEDPGIALALSLVLDPIILALAWALHLAFARLGFDGRITPRTLPWILGLSLAAALVLLVAGTLVRDRLDIGRTAWPRRDAPAIVLIYYFLIFTIWSLVCFWMKAEIARRTERQRAVLAEAHALRTELQRLRLQLDPHFLLNALNGIGEEIPEHPDAALAMLRDLATFLRQSLAGVDVTIAPVGAEMEALASYLRVQEARFGARLQTRLHVDDAAATRPIPSFLLQPLVENAIQHGAREPRLDITIDVRVVDDALDVVVANTGTLAKSARPGGIGLANVRSRLSLHYPGRHAFTLAAEGGRVVARLVLQGAPCSAP